MGGVLGWQYAFNGLLHRYDALMNSSLLSDWHTSRSLGLTFLSPQLMAGTFFPTVLGWDSSSSTSICATLG